jgi:hypothetical protein
MVDWYIDAPTKRTAEMFMFSKDENADVDMD